MPTLAQLRLAREAGVPLRQLGTRPVANIGKVFGQKGDVQHRRNTVVQHPGGPLHALSTPAVNFTGLTTPELRAKRAHYQEELRRAEWAWDRNPTMFQHIYCMMLRTTISYIELKMVEALNGGG